MLKIGSKVKFMHKGNVYTGIIVGYNNVLYRCRVEECLSCSDNNTLLLTEYADIVYWSGFEDEFELIEEDIQDQNQTFLKKLVKIIK